MVGRIGAAVTRPDVVAINVTASGGCPVAELRGRIKETAADHIARICAPVDEFVAGNIELF